MGRRGKTTKAGEHLLFDVLYEDRTRSSEPQGAECRIGDLDRALSAKAYIEAQDREIAEVSGKPRGPIKTLSRSQAK